MEAENIENALACWNANMTGHGITRAYVPVSGNMTSISISAGKGMVLSQSRARTADDRAKRKTEWTQLHLYYSDHELEVSI